MALKLALQSLLFTSTVLAQTVTITKDIPSADHQCIKHCLYRPYNRRIDIGDVLECAAPYEEDCYCPTEDVQAERVSRHIDACATESCSRGDITQDIDKMRAHYATYCVEKGYTVDLVEEWYSALETVASTTAEEEEASTTSEATTEETDNSAASTAASTEGSEDSAASTTEPTSTTASETGDAPAETTEGDGRNPDGLPDQDDGAWAMRPGVLLSLMPLILMGQLL